MDKAVNIDAQAALYYCSFLAVNALVFLICLIAGPHVWSRRLARFFVWFNGLLLLVVVLFLAVFIISEGGIVDEGGVAVGFTLAFSVPILLEFLALLAVARLRLRPRQAASL
jgi:bacteriorhodopsin